MPDETEQVAIIACPHCAWGMVADTQSERTRAELQQALDAHLAQRHPELERKPPEKAPPAS